MSLPQNNPRNDRIKREYLVELKEAWQRSGSTVEQVRRSIDRYEVYAQFADFKAFDKNQAIGFKRALLATKGQRSGTPLSVSTAHHVLRNVKDFLTWLHGKPGFSRHIKPSDIAYLNLTAKEDREAHVSRPKSYATVEQYRAALIAMPSQTEIELRDRAVFAWALVTGMRDAAIISLKLKHVSIERQHVFQDPREVGTKASKVIETDFFPVGDDVISIATDWIKYLINNKLFGPDDPVFPKTAVIATIEQGFIANGLTREHWANATAVRQIFKSAFERVNLPYFKPHSVRHTLVQLAYKMELSPEQLKAYSQGLGHESVLTTLGSYGQVSTERQSEIMMALRDSSGSQRRDIYDEIAEKILQKVTLRVS